MKQEEEIPITFNSKSFSPSTTYRKLQKISMGSLTILWILVQIYTWCGSELFSNLVPHSVWQQCFTGVTLRASFSQLFQRVQYFTALKINQPLPWPTQQFATSSLLAPPSLWTCQAVYPTAFLTSAKQTSIFAANWLFRGSQSSIW